MSIFKNRAIEILWLYQDGLTPLAIARELKMSVKEVQDVINTNPLK
jgi:DNA-binding NarL/FixJ family response regulator